MTIWVDSQLPPAIASWLTLTFSVDAIPLREVLSATFAEAVQFLSSGEPLVEIRDARRSESEA